MVDKYILKDAKAFEYFLNAFGCILMYLKVFLQ
jgi:hypothetical protein